MIYTLSAGEVAVFGSELIGGSQAAKNLGLCLNAVSDYLGKPHKVTSVIFVTDDRLPDRLAACGMDSGAVVINIMHVFCASYDITSIKEPEIAISTLFWHNVYAAYIHEALHLDNETATEDEIDATAKALVYDIVRDNGMEPAIHCQFLDAQIKEMTDGMDDDYSVTQKKMLENRWWFWRKPGKDVTDYKCHSFREYMHLFSGAHEEDHRWLNQPRLKSIAISDTNTSAPATATSAPVATETGNKGHEYSDAEIQAFIEEEMTDLLTPVTENTPAALAFNKAVAGISEFRHLAAAADNAVTAGDGATFKKTVDRATELFQQNPAVAALGNNTGFSGGFSEEDYEAAVGTDFEGDEFSEFEDDGAGSSIVAFAAMSMAGAGAPAPVYNQPASVPPTLVTTLIPAQHSAVKVVLPRTGLTPEQTSEISRGVYSKCFNHIFAHCGQITNSEVGFSNPAAVEIPIQLTDVEKSVVVSMDYRLNGKWMRKVPTTNGLIGHTTSKANLPAYKLYINMDGVELCRLILPQNTAKRDSNGQFTKTAIMAHSGAKIVFVMEGDDNAKASGSPRYICKAVVEPGKPLTHWEAC